MKIVVTKKALKEFLSETNKTNLNECGCSLMSPETTIVQVLKGETPSDEEMATTIPTIGNPVEPVLPGSEENTSAPKIKIEKPEEEQIRDTIRTILIKYFFQNVN